MSIKPGTPYTFMNKQAGLDLYISLEDQISIIGESGSNDRSTVRIACHFDSFCWCTHTITLSF